MDREELARKLKKFRKACEAKGYPLQYIWADETYPGVTDTSYIIKVVADWAQKKGVSKSLDILIDIFWETFPEKERKGVFAFFVNPKEAPPNGAVVQIEKTYVLQAA